MEGQVYNQKVADDFLAAFLHAGIPVNKMSHASIQGLFAKYTKVSGCLPKKSGAYQACSRVREAHLACIRKKLENKKVFVSTDEWTSDQGFAILNILIASEGKVYVTGSVNLSCDGEQMGVEHRAVGQAVLENLRMMNISFGNVMAFVSDSAAVLKKAYEAVLQGACPDALWLPCVAHVFNNCAKSIMTGLDEKLTSLFEKGPGLLHAKRYAARRRRWFAHLVASRRVPSLPVKYLNTRWTIWRDCAEWWIAHWDVFRSFLEGEKLTRKPGTKVNTLTHAAVLLLYSFSAWFI